MKVVTVSVAVGLVAAGSLCLAAKPMLAPLVWNASGGWKFHA